MNQDLRLTLTHVPVTPHIGESVSRLTERLKEIATKTTGVYENHEHSARLPFDSSIRADVTHMVQRYFSTQLRYIIVVGIGGSNLGAKAVYDAIRGTQDGYLEQTPKLIFADTISPRLLLDIEQILEKEISYPEHIVINLISKSGATTESIANFEILYASLLPRFPEIRSRIVVTTDHGSKLWVRAEKEGLGLLPLPQQVGGRFSVFSAVGLFPLTLAGIRVEEFLDGASSTLTTCLTGENGALRLAGAIYRSMHHGVSMVNFFFFNPELESLGKWARQLYAESLGKEKDRSGKVVHAGITPIVSIGSTDLHSMAQLYLGGPKDKFTLFTLVRDRTKHAVPMQGMFLPLVEGLPGKTPDQLMQAIYEGTLAAYASHRLPSGEILLSGVTPYALGQFMEFHMLVVMYLGELTNVNTFDQPNVEDYKKFTRAILAEQK